MDAASVRANRAEWEKRVERWRDSGLTSKEFAAEVGINAATLTYWKWRLGKERREASGEVPKTKPSKPRPKVAQEPREAVQADAPSLVLVDASPSDSRIEVELSGGTRLRVPSSFDADALRRLVAALEGRG